MTVNNRIYLESDLETFEADGDNNIINEYSLVSTSGADPEFRNLSEINGSFTRTQLKFDNSPVLFNNENTYALLSDPTNSDDIASLTFDIKKSRKYSNDPFSGDERVFRQYAFTAKNSTDTELESANNLNIQYAWRYDPDNAEDIKLNEVPLSAMNKISELKLQRWVGDNQTWEENESSTEPIVNDKWLVAQAKLTKFGIHSVGVTIDEILFLLAKVMLEGPYNNDEMRTDIQDQIPTTPPNEYPYNLDPNREIHSVAEVPAEVVDWIVVEFRDHPTNPENRFFRTCFLGKDGSIVDTDGQTPVQLTKLSTNNIDTTGAYYWVAIRHRSHLTIMSQDSLYIGPQENPSLYDFTKNTFCYGGFVKPIGFDESNSLVYGMPAGNYIPNDVSIQQLLDGTFEGQDRITDFDFNSVWNNNILNIQNAYWIQDFNMDGIITTHDFNIS